MVEPYLLVCGALLLGAVLVRVAPVGRRSFDEEHEDGFDLAPRALAYLRSGTYGVVLTVLAELHGIGAVDAGRRIARRDPLRHGRGVDTGDCDCDDRLALAVYRGLGYTRRPRLLALVPSVRRACAPLRWEMRDRRMLPARRQKVFAAWLLLYAVAFAIAGALERHANGSTVVAAVTVVTLAAALLCFAPRRTLAGARELRLHRQALARVAADGHDEAAYLPDLVAAYGAAALRVLCRQYIAAGALAPRLVSELPVDIQPAITQPTITQPAIARPVVASPLVTEPTVPRPAPAQPVRPTPIRPVDSPATSARPVPEPIWAAVPAPPEFDWDRPPTGERRLVGAQRRAA